ncbi:gas vesicle protein GvpJ [Streptomyces europaeiscabiei]|uniref:Gas vesicle protein A n=1 Tax=Streptomyces europaeiscabiei TaxID=146819 RepID=A0ABU4NHK6_9ACTN|nr:gas vesicle protein GvpJ [Streptomyces europaeiscabiei]MDX2526313.1 gas vesicle structural protein GvpA [Streptomyces europaeiscabiei]MDX2759078.1 gas vesicle structural protein GvpA [Streptomyces europaeiscabiei]MDX2767774.1 gas vesicle structural protein GvpA [Streptomyces europaeiscabiei]MDX3549351.1 gas vesicle structural protein GvpA [Streptomyces europaeiscabiei]MDX3552133.1 gas vesicle structural protein GvpA [Streptomyces europaeiscabiei]
MPATTYSDEVVACPPRAGTLYDVLELILDRGMVIDVFVRVSLVGIEILKIDARIVVASVDTYLRFAEACNRLDLERDSGSTTIPELLSGSAAKSIGRRKVRKAAENVGDTVRRAVGGRDDDSDEPDEDEEAQKERPRKRRAPARGGTTRRRPVEA